MDRTSISNRFILTAAALLLSGALYAQNGVGRQMLHTYDKQHNINN